jgi:hypothetical protein
MKQMDFRNELARITPVLRENADARIYVFGAGQNWKNICEMCRRLAAINIDDCIDGFIDNNTAKQGTIFHGKRVYAIEEIDTKKSVILISVASHSINRDILRQLLNFGMYMNNSVFIVDFFFHTLCKYEFIRFVQFKGRHKGQRCFIVGNGSSLIASDLDKLKNEITFGMNNIFLMFDKTDWRPSYFFYEDDELFEQVQDKISTCIESTKFFGCHMVLGVPEFNQTNFHYFHADFSDQLRPNRGPSGFSKEPYFMKWGGTVAYSCLQLAAYMGFSEIYLLGVDFTFLRGVKLNGEIVFGSNPQTHFQKDYNTKKNIYIYPIDTITLAYKIAREYCDAHGIKIRNATRGGALEVFERVDFDSLF